MLFVCLPRTPTLSDAFLLHAPTKEQAEHKEEKKEDGRTRGDDNQTGGHKGLLSGTTDVLGIAAWQELLRPYEKELHIPKQTVLYSIKSTVMTALYAHHCQINV